MQDEKRFYVYVHRRKTDGRIFYVGKGQSYRAFSKARRNPWWYRVVEKDGLEVEITQKGLTNEQAKLLEMWIIAKLRFYGSELTNLTDGGDGNTGWSAHQSVKDKIGLKAKERLSDPRNHPRFIDDEYTWWHQDGRIFKGSALDISIEMGLHLGTIRKVSSGGLFSYKGWKRAGVWNYNNKNGLGNERADKTIYIFSKDCFPNMIGTRTDFCLFYGYKPIRVGALATGIVSKMDGWSIAKL